MLRHLKVNLTIELLLVLNMMLSACGPSAPAVPTVVPATAQSTTVPTAIQVFTPTPMPIPPNPVSNDPNTFIELTFTDPVTLDPSRNYETAGSSILLNIYEGLITFAGSDPVQVKPLLVKTIAEPAFASDGGLSYTWEILSGVKFHNGDTMMAHDVAFSFWRTMLESDFGSDPGFLLLEAFFLNPQTKSPINDPTELVDPSGALIGAPQDLKKADPALLAAACQKVKDAVTFDDAQGTITMKMDHKWGPLMVTLAGGGWAFMQDQSWVNAQGEWDGDCKTWQNFYSIPWESSVLMSKTNGTGPYMLDHWTPNEEIVLIANPNYRDGPAKISRVVKRQVPEFGTRFAYLQSGDADAIWTHSIVDRLQLDTLVRDDCDLLTGQCVPYMPEVDPAGMLLRRYLNVPSVSRADMLLNYKVTENSPYIGSGQLDGEGIPPDFFADINIRKAFAYCFDIDTFIKDMWLGEAVPSLALTLPGQPGYDTATRYPFDLGKCKAAFAASTLKNSNGQSVNAVGFYVQMGYIVGDAHSQIAAEIIADALAKVNSKFLLAPVGLPWPLYLNAAGNNQLAIMTVGWQEDIHDPHNWYVPYLMGNYASGSNFPPELKAKYAKLINAGVFETDQSKRAAIYQQLNQMVYEDVAYIIGAQGLYRNYEPLYLHGWWGSKNQNPMINGQGLYFYSLSKD